MLNRTEKIQFTLSAEEIDRFSDWLDEGLQKARNDRKNRLRFRLSAEEILLRMQTRFGDDTEAEATLDRSMGKTRLQLEIPGAPFNPLSETGDRFGDWNSSLLPAVGMEPKYFNALGKNYLRLYLPARQMNPVLLIAIAIAIGCVLGYVGQFFLPTAVRDTLTEVCFTPLYNVWFRILNALSGPVIFFTSITAVLNTTPIRKQGGSRFYVIGRYFLFSLLCTCLAAFCAYPFFPVQGVTLQLTGDMVREEVDALVRMIPDSALEPFSTSDTPQLLVLAFAVGGALTILGERTNVLQQLIRQINMVGLLLAKWLSRLVPPFITVFLFFEIMNSREVMIRDSWKPLAVFAAVSVVIMLYAPLYLSFEIKERPLYILKQCFPPFITALKNGSLDDALDETEQVCVKGFKIDAGFTQISLPQGAVLYMPISSVGVFIFTVYAAMTYNISMDPLRLLTTILLVVILFVATPPVPGANLLAYIALFSWLGIPDAALISAMIFDIVSGIVANAGNLTLLQTETAIQAKRMGLIELKPK